MKKSIPSFSEDEEPTTITSSKKKMKSGFMVTNKGLSW